MAVFRYLVVAALAFAPVFQVLGQETTASGNLQVQSSWNALKTLVDEADSKARTAQILANAIKDCGVKGMFYSPGVSGADAKGCKAPPTPAPGFSRVTYYGSSAYSSNSVVTSG